MKLWPHDSFEIETTMSREEALSLLDSTIPNHFRDFGSDRLVFEGNIDHDLERFRIWRRGQRGRNNSPPIISGKLRAGKLGTIVTIKIGLSPVKIAFVCLLPVVFCLCLEPLFKDSNSHQEFIGGAIVLLGMTVGLLAGITWEFWREVKEQKAALIKLFTNGTTSQRKYARRE